MTLGAYVQIEDRSAGCLRFRFFRFMRVSIGQADERWRWERNDFDLNAEWNED